MTEFVWYVQLKCGAEFPFLKTTREGLIEDDLHNMMPKKGIGYLIPVVGELPTVVGIIPEFHQGRWFVYAEQSDVIRMWCKDEEPSAQHITFHDKIQASTTEST